MPNDDNWPLYFEKTEGNSPRPNLIKAIESFNTEDIQGICIDIGSGAGNDIQYLLENDWKVLGFDAEPSSSEIIQRRFPKEQNLQFKQASFKEIELPPVQLINCSFVLPFCDSKYLDIFMQKICDSIQVNGRFSGNFFGLNHSWDHLCLRSREDVLGYFNGFKIEHLYESQEERTSALGEEIMHHNIDIVVKKIK